MYNQQKSNVKNNLMNTFGNPDKSIGTRTGVNLTKGQREKMEKTIQKEQKSSNVFIQIKLLFLVIFFTSSCNYSQNHEESNNTLLKHDSLKQADIFDEETQISYNEIIDTSCDSNNVQMEVISTTHIIFETKKNDSISISYNDTIFYNGRLNEIINRIILVYDEKYKRISSGVKGYFNIDNKNENVFKIKFIEKNSYIEFNLLKRTKLITITEEKFKWHIVYSNCIKQNDE